MIRVLINLSISYMGWLRKLILYPNGDDEVEDHISLYLAITSKDNLPLGWEVKVIFRFFVYDRIKDNYLTVQGIDISVRNLHNGMILFTLSISSRGCALNFPKRPRPIEMYSHSLN